MTRPVHRGVVLALALVVSLIATLAAGGTALAAIPNQDIASSGPLEHVYIGNELSCQVAHTGDTDLEFYPPSTIPGDCGTFLAVGGTLYAPDFVNHDGSATGGLGAYTAFTPVSQTGVTGSGTTANPYKVVTVVDAGSTGLRLEQTDTYVVGDEAYRTDVKILNTGNSAVTNAVLYRAGDCFLAGSDTGFGFTETLGTRKAVGCSVNADNTPAGRIEEWVPLTGGNNFFQAGFSEVWAQIGTQASFPDTCECSTFQDNGAGISWTTSIAAGGSATYSHSTVFSPTGKEALQTTKTADSPTSTAGSNNGYTITISNPNAGAVTLDNITDQLPTGFTYNGGSTTGATTSNPSMTTIAGQQNLTWSEPFVVPGGGSVSLHFGVKVSSTPGDYLNNAGGNAADGYTVLGTGDTARITVRAPSGCRMSGIGNFLNHDNTAEKVRKHDKLNSDTSKAQDLKLQFGPASLANFVAGASQTDRFVMTSITSAVCSNDPAYDPGQGQTLDTIKVVGTGTYQARNSGVVNSGYRVEITIKDGGESGGPQPGAGLDFVHVKVFNPAGAVIQAARGKLQHGNQDALDGTGP